MTSCMQADLHVLNGLLRQMKNLMPWLFSQLAISKSHIYEIANKKEGLNKKRKGYRRLWWIYIIIDRPCQSMHYITCYPMGWPLFHLTESMQWKSFVCPASIWYWSVFRNDSIICLVVMGKCNALCLIHTVCPSLHPLPLFYFHWSIWPLC